MAILEVRSITKSFGGVMALDSVTVDVEKNTLLGIIGPNGSGKTTSSILSAVLSALTPAACFSTGKTS